MSTATSSMSDAARTQCSASPTDVRIHDNYFRRNGRQGVAVTHGFNVVHRAQRHRRHSSGDVRPRAGKRDRKRPQRVDPQQQGRPRSPAVRRGSRCRRCERRLHPEQRAHGPEHGHRLRFARPCEAAEHRRHRQRERYDCRHWPRFGVALRRLRLHRRAQQPPADASRPQHAHGRHHARRARSLSRTTTSPMA